jgi:pyridoxamine 5'-phosphate oxidase family protein
MWPRPSVRSRSRGFVVSVGSNPTTKLSPIAFTLRPSEPTRNSVGMAFTDEELDYLRSQPLARLATVAPDGQPDVTPVALEVEGTTLWVCGAGEAVLRTRKIRNITAGHRQVALVVDDLPSVEPFIARGIRIYGTAEDPIDRVGMVGLGHCVRVTPRVSWSWNLEGAPAGDTWYEARRTVHQRA